MAKILFVTTRNIYSMCGELQLIKNRHLTLKKKFGIETDFYALTGNDKLSRQQASVEAENVDFTFFKTDPINFISGYKKMLKKVLFALKSEEYSIVVISGAFPFNIAKSIKKNKDIKIVYDSHAAWEELIEFNATFNRKLRYKLFTKVEKGILSYCDYAFAVSNELKNYLKNKYGWNKETFIVPCATSKPSYTVSEAMEFRNKWRTELGVNNDEILFIYSGGVSPWQSIDKAYEIFLKYKNECGKAKFLIMTPHPEGMDYPEATIMSFPSSQVGEVLFAGDVAFLIRENFITNHVAFPNKYLEYVLSNMLIISTPYLKDISREIKEKNLGIIIEKVNNFSSSVLENALENSASFEERFSLRKEIADNHSFARTLKKFAEKTTENVDK